MSPGLHRSGATAVTGSDLPSRIKPAAERRAEQLDALAAILPIEGRDRLSRILTDQDVATLTHLAREGIGPNSLRALDSDLAYLDIWAPASTGSIRSPLKAARMTTPARLPDAASLERVLAGLDPAAADADLIPALTAAFPGFEFKVAPIDDDYWRDTRSVLRPDGTRIDELRPWMMAEIAKEGGDIKAVWARLKQTDLQITEWRGTSAFVSAPTGSGAADYIQIALGREIEWRAGPIVNPDYQPWGESELLDPSWPRTDQLPDSSRLAGPVYRLLGRAGGAVVHVRSFLDRCGRIERDKREAKRPEMERRIIREVGTDGTSETPFLEAVPDWFDHVPREIRFFRDWEDSSASAQRVFAHWALDIRDYTHKGEREVGFIPRPLRPPKERLLMTPDVSVHLLMGRIEAMDREIELPFGWFFLMTHGHWVDPDVGRTIAQGLKAQRVRLPDRDARVLLRWTDRTYGF